MTKKQKNSRKILCFLVPSFLGLFVFLSFSTPAAAQQESTSSVRKLVRERVKEKLENLGRKPTAVTGTLEQITDSTLEIKTREGKVLLASTSKDTIYFRVSGDKRKETKFDELVIGEFAVAMGFRNGKDILETKRVIISDKNPIPAKHSVYGTATVMDKGALTIEHPKTKEVWTVKTTGKTILTAKMDGQMQEAKLTDINIGDRIVAAGTPDTKASNTLEAKRIHVIPGKARGLLKPSVTPTPKPTKKPTPTPTSTP